MPTIAFKRLTDADIALPSYQTPGASGMDLPAAVTEPTILNSGERKLIPCGFAMAIPEGFEAQIRPRSGLARRFGITVLNSPGTIDSDYRGEICVLLVNHGTDAFTITRGERVAQLVVGPVARVAWKAVETLPDTTRGEGGFGHTGS